MAKAKDTPVQRPTVIKLTTTALVLALETEAASRALVRYLRGAARELDAGRHHLSEPSWRDLHADAPDAA